MRGFTARSLSRFIIGTSALALVGLPGIAMAQDAAAGRQSAPLLLLDPGYTPSGQVRGFPLISSPSSASLSRYVLPRFSGALAFRFGRPPATDLPPEVARIRACFCAASARVWVRWPALGG